MCNNNILSKIWVYSLICAMGLLLLCIPLANSGPNTIFHDLLVVFAVGSVILLIICFVSACWFKISVFSDYFTDYQEHRTAPELLNNDPELATAVVQVSNNSDVFVISPSNVIVNELNNVENVGESIIVVAEPLNSV